MPATSYLNFDILPQRQNGSYRAAVIDSPVGRAACDFTLPLTDEELARFLQSVLHTTSGRKVAIQQILNVGKVISRVFLE